MKKKDREKKNRKGGHSCWVNREEADDKWQARGERNMIRWLCFSSTSCLVETGGRNRGPVPEAIAPSPLVGWVDCRRLVSFKHSV